jgi:hypothetical protein
LFACLHQASLSDLPSHTLRVESSGATRVMTFKTKLSPHKSATLLAHLTPEERDRYVRWWRRFRLFENIAWIGWLGVAFGYLTFSYSVPTEPRWKLLFVVIFGCGFLLGMGATVWIWVLYCPRCGEMLGNRGYHPVTGMLMLVTPLWFRLCPKCGLKRKQLSDLARYG